MSILIINPFPNPSVTERLKEATDPAPDFTYKFFTAPGDPQSGHSSVTSEVLSVQACLEALLPVLDQHDGFLVAANSDHPLIHVLREHTDKPVLGTLQASIIHALALGGGKFAIVTTARSRHQSVEAAALAMLGHNPLYCGTFSTSYGSFELSELSPSAVADEMAAVTATAMEAGAKYILLAFPAQVHLEDAVRRVAARNAVVIDGTKAGAEILVGLARSFA